MCTESPKRLPHGADVGYQAIRTDQEGPTCRTAPDPLTQPPDQGHVPLRTDRAAQPQARLDHHSQCHPHNAALFLDAEFIGLHLPQVTWLFDQGLVHGLPLLTGTGPPRGDRPLVKRKTRHNRLQGTPMGEQGHDDDHSFCRGTQPIEDRACGGAEGFVALMTDEPLLLPRVVYRTTADKYFAPKTG